MLVHKDRTRIIPFFLFHQGCRNRCSFCNQHSMVSTKNHTPSDILSFINTRLKPQSHTLDTEIAFFGGSFTDIGKESMIKYLETVQESIDKGWISGIRVSARPDSINEDILLMLKQYGVTTVCLGIESIHSDILKNSGRFYNITQINNSIQLLNKLNMKVILQLMLGLPKDTYNKCLETIIWASEQNIAGVRLSPVLILKNTELEQQYLDGSYKLWDDEIFYELLEKAVLIFYQKRIPILRFGLCLEKAINDNYITGLIHPSLGDYIEYRTVFKILSSIDCNDIINDEIHLHHGLKPYIYGYRKENYDKLKKSYKIIFSENGISKNDIKEIAVNIELNCG